MENPKDQLIERIKSANNVLVTVSSNPSVDQLSAAIGLTLTLNKMGKHATAVYSGSTPSTIEFLKPEKTIEKNTDSLRDFIIALDKSKADKLRYKVEQDHVKIFITPYRTSISDKDLEFSQGDFNVDVVVALGVTDQKDLDQAITSHGRILHDATTISVTTGQQSNLGTINWAESSASSLCEMIVGIADTLQEGVLDGQIATAFMTGIVAETDRFSNDKTSSTAMSASAKLMAAGANQQLVASELQEKPEPEISEVPQDDAILVEEPNRDDNSFQIAHDADLEQPAEEQAQEPDWQSYESVGNELPDVQAEETPQEEPVMEDTPAEPESQPEQESEPEPEVEQPLPEEPVQNDANDSTPEPVMDMPTEEPAPEPEIPEISVEKPVLAEEPGVSTTVQGGGSVVFEPPTRGGKLTANTEPEDLDPAVDPLAGGGHDGPILNHNESTDGNVDMTMPADDANREEIPPPSMTLPSEASAIMPTWDVPAQTQPAVPQPDPFAMPTPPLAPAYPPVPEPTQQNAPVDSVAPTMPAMEPVVPEVAPPEIAPEIMNARDAVAAAVAGDPAQPLPPIQALNAAPLDLEIKQTGETGMLDHDTPPEPPQNDTAFSMPENLVPTVDALPMDPTASDVNNPAAPPPVPPPLMPPSFGDAALPPMPDQQVIEQPAPVNNNPQNPFNLPPA